MNSETVASIFAAIIGSLGGTAGITGIISALKTKKEAKKMEQENKEALNKIDTKLMIINNKIDMVMLSKIITLIKTKLILINQNEELKIMPKKLFWLKMLIYFLNFITLGLVSLGKLISEKIEILKKQVKELENK